MNANTIKKIISVVCVLSILMSVCVVSLVSFAGAAAQQYTLFVNGVPTLYDEGTALPATADSGIPGVNFLGWYDATLTNRATTASAGDVLYAKFSSHVYNFDAAKEHNGVYDPLNKTIMNGGTAPNGRWDWVDDPTGSANKAIKINLAGVNNTLGLESVPGSNTTLTLVGDTTYQISFKYYSETTSNVVTQLYLCGTQRSISDYDPNDGKINAGFEKTIAPITGTWTEVSYTFKYNKQNHDSYIAQGKTPYVLFALKGNGGAFYVDDIIITEAKTQEYTFNDKGVETVKTLDTGAELPIAKGSLFEGWYDATLTQRYVTVPATVTKLYAKYSRNLYDFESAEQIFDPNNNLGTQWSNIVDPAKAGNHVMSSQLGAGEKNFALIGASDANSGIKLIKNQQYEISYKFKVTGADNKDVVVKMMGAKTNDIGTSSSTASSLQQWTYKFADLVGNADADGWVTITETFLANIDSKDYPHLIFVTSCATAVTGDIIYIDDFQIYPKNPAAIGDDFVMDFEDDFEWSVAGANSYTVNSGNGYVNRGEIITESGNSFFRMQHFKNKDGYFWFTLDDGTKTFEVVDGGIYKLTFKYKVESSITDSKLGIMLVKPTTASTGLQYNSQGIVVIDEFKERKDDSFYEVSYIFVANLSGNPSCKSLALFVQNSTNVPQYNIDTGEYTGTKVAFDDIKVSTHSVSGFDGLITFDSQGGAAVNSYKVSPSELPVGVLPETTRYGYNFVGWKYDVVSGEGTNQTVTTYDLTADTIVRPGVTNAYATWKLKDDYVQLTFKSNVSEFDEKNYTVVTQKGKPIQGMPADPKAPGQKFLGWFCDTGFSRALDTKNAPSESGTCYAKWENNEIAIDFDDYPTEWFDTEGPYAGKYTSGPNKLVDLGDGNKALFYDGTQSEMTTMRWPTALYNKEIGFVKVAPGVKYDLYVRFMVVKGYEKHQYNTMLFHLSGENSVWTDRLAQTQASEIYYSSIENVWNVGQTQLIPQPYKDKESATMLSFGCGGDGQIYIDRIVITPEVNSMNIYGTAIVLNTNSDKGLQLVSGEEGTPINIPTPVKPGYKFDGWYEDSKLTTPFTQEVYDKNTKHLYAKWKIGKFIEDFENYPISVKALGVSTAYSFYSQETEGYDKANVTSGDVSLFRTGANAGAKAFTLMRDKGLALNIGDTYTLTMKVKPTSITDVNGTISLINTTSYATGINNPASSTVISKVADLKEGEWNTISYTFTATTQFLGISTSAGNDMYFDDATIVLKGFTGNEVGAPMGDSSISPVILVAIILLSAVALAVTCKKVYSK